MSQIHVKSPKHCAEKQALKSHRFNRKLFFYFITILLTILSFIVLVWLILHPTKPQFSLQEAQINQLNLTSTPPLVNSSIQITLLSKNPNNRVGIYYDEFRLYASYKEQKVTPDSSISPFYQGHKETNLLSSSLIGKQQPVAPSFVYEVQHDQSTGKLALNFKVIGKLRWKVGSWVSGRYRLAINCVATLQSGHVSSQLFISKQGTQCSTVV
ncbi:NDR1/HIN1-like protein 26 [Primulina eburnea]|uniref:NDR1/HIN1-like protein 26 n=1 Tax=Primulina eburnea TaxID=1245227 RepID=UPI003C6CBD0B